MDKSIFLQKQVRDNSEDLQNYMRDLKHWEHEMKRKDEALLRETSDPMLPPVRRKVKKINNDPLKKVKTPEENPKKRIASNDYSAWEKLDIDKMCEEIDKVEEEEDDENEEDAAVADDKRRREYAMYEKDLGNQYVKQGDWDKAIESYTLAINSYPNDAIFYANRALCYLKKNKFKKVEVDCTASIHLDETYVKAYQRRAAARQKLSQLVEARQDLVKIIELEPKNVQAKKDLATLDAKLKPLNEKHKEKQPEKQKTNLETDEKSKIDMKPKPIVEVNTEEDPAWNSDACIIDHVQKPHLRSKKPLQRIEIKEVNDSSMDDTGKLITSYKLSMQINSGQKDEQNNLTEGKTSLESSKSQKESSPTEEKSSSEYSKPKMELSPTEEKSSSESSKPKKESSPIKLKSNFTITSLASTSKQTHSKFEEMPPPPKTAIQFQMHWNKIKTKPNICYQYLKQIHGTQFPVIFKDALESDIFSNILAVLATEFINSRSSVIDYLLGLTGVRRFSTLVLFMTDDEKANVSRLIEYCREMGESVDDISALKRLYEL